MGAFNKFIPVLPLVGRIVDTLFPFAVGKRTALAVAGKAITAALRAFGVEVPTEVDTALDAAAVTFATASLGRSVESK